MSEIERIQLEIKQEFGKLVHKLNYLNQSIMGTALAGHAFVEAEAVWSAVYKPQSRSPRSSDNYNGH